MEDLTTLPITKLKEMQQELKNQGLFGWDYSEFKDIQDIEKQIIELQKQKKFLEEKYREQSTLAPKARKAEYDYIQKIINERQAENKKKRGLEISEELETWVKKVWGKGANWGYGNEPLKIVWVSDDEKYLIITNKGSMYASGLNYNYGKATHMAVRAMQGTWHDQPIDEVEGRLTNAKKERLIIAIEEHRKDENN